MIVSIKKKNRLGVIEIDEEWILKRMKWELGNKKGKEKE